jgi:hypothetical protein
MVPVDIYRMKPKAGENSFDLDTFKYQHRPLGSVLEDGDQKCPKHSPIWPNATHCHHPKTGSTETLNHCESPKSIYRIL